MKQILLTAALALSFTGLMAQNSTLPATVPGNTNVPRPAVAPVPAPVETNTAPAQSRTSRSEHDEADTFTTWYNYANAVSEAPINGEIIDGFAPYMGPNKLQYWVPGNTTTGDPARIDTINWISVGMTLDPTEEVWKWAEETHQLPTTGAGARYRVDALRMAYVYGRATDESVVDTLVVQFYVDNQAPSTINPRGLEKWYFGNPQDSTSPRFGTARFNKELTIGRNAFHTVRIPLAAENATPTEPFQFSQQIVEIDMPFISTTNIVAATFSFRMGTEYQPFDTIGMVDGVAPANPHNYFRFLMWYNSAPDQQTVTRKRYYNNGMLANRQVLDSANWFIGPDTASPRYLPSNAWTGVHFLPDVDFLVTAQVPEEPMGISPELLALGAMKLYPNPATDQLVMTLDLGTPTQASVVLRDLNGRAIVQRNLGTTMAGTNQYTFDISNLAPGMYMVQLQTTQGTATQKLIISR